MIPRRTRRALGEAEGSKMIRCDVLIDMRTAIVSVSSRPPRFTLSGICCPSAFPYRARNFVPNPSATGISPTLINSSPDFTPAASAAPPGSSSVTTTAVPAESIAVSTPMRGSRSVSTLSLSPASGNVVPHGNGSRPSM
jgi:hypothetical protein